MNPILLDERLSAAAELAREALTGMERPVAADIGCDHGFLTAKLLETVPNLTMLASDVSAPSLEKARRLLAVRGLSVRGCYYTIEDFTLASDTSRGVSNVVTADEAVFTVREGDLMLFHYSDIHGHGESA